MKVAEEITCPKRRWLPCARRFSSGAISFSPVSLATEARDPYRVLLAESLLHRTQVKQMIAVYERLVAAYRDIRPGRRRQAALDALLFSLGLRWHRPAARHGAGDQHPVWGSYPDRQGGSAVPLSGVSEYIAGAVRCFAWNQPETLMDTNTVRITGRLLGWPVKDSSGATPASGALETLVPNPKRTTSFQLRSA